jgi:hypothetical protein
MYSAIAKCILAEWALVLVLSLSFGLYGCFSARSAVALPQAVLPVAPTTTGTKASLDLQLVQAERDKATATANVAVLKDEIAEQEAEHVRAICYIAGGIALLILAVSTFLAIRLPVFTKTLWSLAGASGVFAAVAFTAATYWKYMLYGGAALVVAGVTIGVILILKHASAIIVLQSWVTRLESDWGPGVATTAAKASATVAAAAAGVTALVKK